MPVTAELTRLEDDKVRLDIVVSEDEVQRQTDTTLRRIGGSMSVPGFRPGKVPANVVMQRLGRPAVVEEMLKDAIGEWYSAAVADAGVEPVADPDLSLEDVPDGVGELAFAATVQLRPTATLGEYRGLEVARQEAALPEGALATAIEELRERAARLEVVERPAARGDFVTIDFDGTVKGKRLPDASARDFVVELGSERLVGAFEESLTGMSAGESGTFPMTYADDDPRPQLRARTVDYTITLKQVQEKVLPELNDEVVAEISEYETVDALNEAITQELMTRVEAAETEVFRRRAIDAAVRNATVDVPSAMTDRRVHAILHQSADRLPEGVSLEEYLAASGRTIQDLIAELTPDAEMAIRRELVVEAVAEAEQITATDEEVEAQIVADAETTERDPAELRAELERVDGIEQLRRDMALRKAVDLLVETARPISLAEAEAKEKLWTPDKQREKSESGESKLWTPGSGPAKAPRGPA